MRRSRPQFPPSGGASASSVAAAGNSAQAADDCADSDTPAVQVTVPLVGADLEEPVMSADVFAS